MRVVSRIRENASDPLPTIPRSLSLYLSARAAKLGFGREVEFHLQWLPKPSSALHGDGGARPRG